MTDKREDAAAMALKLRTHCFAGGRLCADRVVGKCRNCTAADMIDALSAELTAARTVADGEVAEAIRACASVTAVYRHMDLSMPIDILTRLSAAKEEAERLLQVERGAMDLQANLLKGAEAKADTAERERDEARDALAQAREQIAILRAPIDEALAECGHSSDCAVYNMPALPNGPCNCWQSKFSALAQGEQ